MMSLRNWETAVGYFLTDDTILTDDSERCISSGFCQLPHLHICINPAKPIWSLRSGSLQYSVLCCSQPQKLHQKFVQIDPAPNAVIRQNYCSGRSARFKPPVAE